MSRERVHYSISKDSPVMEVIRAAEEKQRVFGRACNALRKKYPGATVWTWEGYEVSGIAFPGELPAGWRQTKRGYAKPDKRVKVGREIAKELEQVPRGVCARTFSSMLSTALNEDYVVFADDAILFTVFEWYGESCVLSVPLACKGVPPKCVELKMSEYWALREAAEKKEKRRSGRKVS